MGLTSANWLDAPYNRLGFRRVATLICTERISRGAGPVFDLPRAERDLGGFEFEHQGRSLDLATMLEETYTDGRSEERRVGKECRSRWSRCRGTKKEHGW